MTEQYTTDEQTIAIDSSDFINLRESRKYKEFLTGLVRLTSGEVVITDPLRLFTLKALERKLAPRPYPVYLYFHETQHGFKPCYAMLEVKKGTPVKWEVANFATSTGHKANFKINGKFPVESNLLSLSDLLTIKQYQAERDAFFNEHEGGNFYDDYLEALFNKNGNNPRRSSSEGDWLDYFVKGGNTNVIMFSSGIANGLFPAYWGLDAHGEVNQLVIDFEVGKHTSEA